MSKALVLKLVKEGQLGTVLKYLFEVTKLKVRKWYTINSHENTRVELTSWLGYQSDESRLINLAGELKGTTSKETILNILKWAHNTLTYVGDDEVWSMPENWSRAIDTFYSERGDCFAGYEKIHTKEGIKQIDKIRVGDKVLSYDFKTKDYVYKPIIKHWSKGNLQVNRIHFRNGQHIDVSEDHPMWCRSLQKKSSYSKQKLSEIDLTRWWKRKVPIAKKIPYQITKTNMHKDLYTIIGHYIAEGWNSKYKVESSGYELIEHIIPLLEKHNIPFTEYENNSGVPCIRFLQSEFKEYLKGLKRNSFDITLYEELITSEPEKLEALIYGMWLGDGTKNIGKNQYNKEWLYNTSSEQLSKDIQRMGLYLGRTFHIWKQLDHKGIGNKPIYRITYNPQSYFLKDYGYNDISEVSISYIEKLDKTEMYDLTVADTHTVVMENGIITHQCEDGAILIYILAHLCGIPDYRIQLVAGNVVGGGHCYCVFTDTNGIEYPIDWCYWYKKSVAMKIPYSMRYEYYSGQKEWFRTSISGSYINK